MSNTLFPIFVKTDIHQFLVIGGGNIGLDKMETLVKQNPEVKVKLVAKEIFPKTKQFLLENPQISWEERPFEKDDLNNVNLIIAAANDPELNKQVLFLAHELNLLVNVADNPSLCDFYLGSYITKGNLKIAISTNGKSPVLARRMREFFEETLPDNIDDSLENLYEYRQQHGGNFQEKLNDLNKITKNIIQ